MYRLFIDIPLEYDQGKAISHSLEILQHISETLNKFPTGYIAEYNYRLGNDEDRGKKDYLRINENGHAANGKQKIILRKEEE